VKESKPGPIDLTKPEPKVAAAPPSTSQFQHQNSLNENAKTNKLPEQEAQWRGGAEWRAYRTTNHYGYIVTAVGFGFWGMRLLL
jgi:hypothetical protein